MRSATGSRSIAATCCCSTRSRSRRARSRPSQHPDPAALRPARQLGAGRGDRAGGGGMIEPRVEFVYEAVAELGPPVDQGAAPDGQRRHIPILGGTFEGPLLRGEILPGGADWQVTRSDGVLAARRDLCDADRRRRRDPGPQPRHALRPARSDGGAGARRAGRSGLDLFPRRAAIRRARRAPMTGSTGRSSCAPASAGRTASGCGCGRWSERSGAGVAGDAFLHPGDLLGRRLGLAPLSTAP